ncbi:MAG: hypothetical protein JXB07_07770 [Anaerolineae bacterium]|nr:hypothetical protein [Anaerolineae bacterium]
MRHDQIWRANVRLMFRRTVMEGGNLSSAAFAETQRRQELIAPIATFQGQRRADMDRIGTWNVGGRRGLTAMRGNDLPSTGRAEARGWQLLATGQASTWWWNGWADMRQRVWHTGMRNRGISAAVFAEARRRNTLPTMRTHLAWTWQTVML